MTGKVYLRTILPVGLLYSLSLISGNKAYQYLSVSFIQMLKVDDPFGDICRKSLANYLV